MTQTELSARPRHEAMLYAGDDDFVTQVGGFVRDGVEAAEPTLVVVAPRKIEALRAALGPRADRVRFADMEQVGRNPGRIIDAWNTFVSEFSPGTRLRGVGEPIDSGRHGPVLDECHVHEALLNIAIADSALWLVCPYDTSALDTCDLETAARTHPVVTTDAVSAFTGAGVGADGWFRGPLSEPAPELVHLDAHFDVSRLTELRAVVTAQATACGVSSLRASELAVAISEAATNSLLYGGGEGRMRCWVNADRLVCEISDKGRIEEPLVGRIRPARGQSSGYGLWVAQQLCDLVQLRSGPDGTVVRLHLMR